MPTRIFTIEPLDSEAGTAIVVGRRASGYAIVGYSRRAIEAIDAVEFDLWALSRRDKSAPTPESKRRALRRLRRFAVADGSELHSSTIARWETIHGELMPLVQYRREHNV